MPSQQRETNPILERKSKIEKKKKKRRKKSVLLYFAFFIRYSLVILFYAECKEMLFGIKI